MKKYWAYWKRGWWFWLLMLCANITVGALISPLAFMFHDNERIYWISAIAMWLVVGAPLWGWLFEKFVSGSKRLVTSEPDDGWRANQSLESDGNDSGVVR